MSATQDSIVKLNVGGTHYVTSLTTINNSPKSMLAKAVSDRWKKEDSNEPIFFDRDGQRFKYVLDYLRDGKVNLPVGENVETFRTELEYFGIDIDPDSITSDEDMEIVSFKSRFRNHMKRLEDQIEVSERSHAVHLIAKDVVKRDVELQSRNCLEAVDADITSEIIYKRGKCNDLVYNFLQKLKRRGNIAENNECERSINALTVNFKLGITVKDIKTKETRGPPDYRIELSSTFVSKVRSLSYMASQKGTRTIFDDQEKGTRTIFR
ncbi:hypothetical protein CTEN210_11928 [Chaetoceros tenuissimus]|uniref:BTB domain-containing protein n=1 Tax=Chaetoceros tenuissimus TaxID=426638 RepID=A0AAD3D081_9STRA|nr:hypothetical protein CTEN210_11928 [Chaetoceros tenuissimus]